MKWWHDYIVEAVDHHWLISTSLLDVWKVFEQQHLLLIGIWVHPHYTVTPGKVGPDFGKLGSVWIWNDGIMTLLRIYTTTDCFPHPYWIYGMCLSTFICCGYAYMGALLHLWRTPRLRQMGVSVAEMKWWHDGIVETVDHHILLPKFIFDIW